jgi:lanosterol synthase
MMNGTNGSQLWDTAFYCQAGVEAGWVTPDSVYAPVWDKALRFLDACQIRTNAPFHTYRQMSLGAWPFSNRHQSYTVSDCTAEALKTVLYLQNQLPSATPHRITTARLRAAVDVLLSMTNANGGFASYEKIRGPQWLEWLNPADVFGNIMIEYPYPECTSAVILGLTTALKYDPTYRAHEIRALISKAIEYLHNSQRTDPEANGAWVGSWGVCFTYATWLVVEALVSVNGETYATSPVLRRACDFLVRTQRPDGGWGESFKSCVFARPIPHDEAQVVNTSWAVLALMQAQYPNRDVIRSGVEVRWTSYDYFIPIYRINC